MFVAPTLEVAGLDWSPKKETKSLTNPDYTRHEIGKFLRLALKGNPTILELFWAETYTQFTFQGAQLLDLRKAVLSEDAVLNSYFGYARSQAKKLENRGDSFSADTSNRTAKHARHMLRLIQQAKQLVREGELTLKVPDPERYWAFDDMEPSEMLSILTEELETAKQMVGRLRAHGKIALPEEPDTQKVRKVLREIRKENL